MESFEGERGGGGGGSRPNHGFYPQPPSQPPPQMHPQHPVPHMGGQGPSPPPSGFHYGGAPQQPAVPFAQQAPAEGFRHQAGSPVNGGGGGGGDVTSVTLAPLASCPHPTELWNLLDVTGPPPIDITYEDLSTVTLTFRRHLEAAHFVEQINNAPAKPHLFRGQPHINMSSPPLAAGELVHGPPQGFAPPPLLVHSYEQQQQQQHPHFSP